MAITETARKNHEELFSGHQSTLATTDPESVEMFDNFAFDEVVVSRSTDDMRKHTGTFDFILDTISADHDLNAFIQFLRRDGNITLVGAPTKPLSVDAFGLLFGRHTLSSSLIGGIRETQEMLDFCGAHNITADVKVIKIKDIDEAYERMLKSDMKYRFVNDMASLKP
jgi:uncharacterized zinc-type alcohol dehydrogenase-like protein